MLYGAPYVGSLCGACLACCIGRSAGPHYRGEREGSICIKIRI